MTTLNFDTLDAVPEGLRESAVEAEGKYSVKVAPAAKLAEFRDSNIALKQSQDDLLNTIGKISETTGIKLLGPKEEGGLPRFDMDGLGKTFKTLTTTAQRVKDGELVENNGLEEALAERTKGMKDEFEGRITALSSERDAHKARADGADTKLRQRILSEQVTRVVLNPESGVRPEAITDVLARASAVFEVKDDESLVPKDPANGKIMYGANAEQPMTVKEWVETLKKSSPHYFKDSVGGGAGSDNVGGAVDYGSVAGMDPAKYRELRKQGKL